MRDAEVIHQISLVFIVRRRGEKHEEISLRQTSRIVNELNFNVKSIDSLFDACRVCLFASCSAKEGKGRRWRFRVQLRRVLCRFCRAFSVKSCRAA
jgi:hypothetical protein